MGFNIDPVQVMNKELIEQELVYKAIRSGGAGGQHVNKVSSKVQLLFDIKNSKGLSHEEKDRLLEKLVNQLNKLGVLLLSADKSRSQLQNRTLVTKRFYTLIEEGLKVQKKRRATNPSKASKEKRLLKKKIVSKIKSNRAKPDRDS